ncbi:Short-chain dehydrogenase/reductase SDR [Macrophomina phaseolina MS6]|uniref:Short-chain dehydrogenase/reductase SDR n=1 Tax=Macrophomina phaseolina (strain MS6) TaxID=1126212 RepID=K2RR12_MACPH|nr:Short-chain dehydrogenase/reductase SDR [Macrophomina phaseolina MS6]
MAEDADQASQAPLRNVATNLFTAGLYSISEAHCNTGGNYPYYKCIGCTQFEVFAGACGLEHDYKVFNHFW